MPLEIVLKGIDKKSNYKEINFQNFKLVVEPLDVNKGKIVQLLSSDPQDFLNPSLSPGNTITFPIK